MLQLRMPLRVELQRRARIECTCCDGDYARNGHVERVNVGAEGQLVKNYGDARKNVGPRIQRALDASVMPPPVRSFIGGSAGLPLALLP